MSDLVEPLSATKDEVHAPRHFVPSHREVEQELADYSFEPLPPAAPKLGFSLRSRAKEMRDNLRPSTIIGGYAALPLVLLTLDAAFTRWDDSAFVLLVPEIRDTFDVDVRFLIGLSALLDMIATLIGPAMGYIADRRNRVRMLAIGNVLQNSASVAAGMAPTAGLLAATRGVGGLGQGVSRAAIVPLLSDWYPFEVRARLIMYITAVGYAAGLVAPISVGLLAELLGWRVVLMGLGALATVISLSFFLLRDPPRGRFDRMLMGADEATAEQEQKPVSWSEGWRAARQIVTLRRIWYATPFLLANFYIAQGVSSLYFADEFGVSPFGRGVIAAVGTTAGFVGVALLGPITDRMIGDRPGRVFTLLSGILAVALAMSLVMAFSPYLWLSVLAGSILLMGGLAVLPLEITMISIVVPARMRGLGVASMAPWQLMGQVFVQVLLFVVPFGTIRGALFLLIPINLAAIVLIASAGAGVDPDIRAARAASMADVEARRARESGRTKMIVCRDVDVTYESSQVLHHVDFDVEEGEIVALLGTNGAGKSTLLRAIAGIQQASNGAIFLDGQDITHKPAHENAQAGIVFMPGGRAVFPSLTVAENLRAAAWMYREDDEYVAAQTDKVLGFFPVLRERVDQLAGTMSGGEQQMLALGQAFLMRPRLLMIDELSLGLAPAVVEQLLDIIRDVNSTGTTVILVEQSVNVALTIARRAVFMDKGEIRFDGPTVELLDRSDLLRSVFLGGAGAGAGGGPFIAASSGLARVGAGPARERVLLVEHVAVSYGGHQALRDAHLHVDSTEVVGVIGPNGAGKTTLFDVISGYTTPAAGKVEIAGADAAGLGPDARARLGLARSFQNARLFPALTVRENIAVALEKRMEVRSMVATAAWLPKVRRIERRAQRRIDHLVDLLNLESYANKFVAELSTGTRRMVDMACVMAAEPKLLLLDEPSSGLAQSEVEVLGPVVRRLARETGCGVLVIEHDIPLVVALSDRMVAMELGAVIAEGEPQAVVDDPIVIGAYLGASDVTINRSGDFTVALAAAGLLPGGASEPEPPAKSTRTRKAR